MTKPKQQKTQKPQTQNIEEIKTRFIKWLENHEGVLFDYHAFWFVQNCVGDLIGWKDSPAEWLTERQKEKWLAPDKNSEAGAGQDAVTPTKKVVIHIDNSTHEESSEEKEEEKRKTRSRRQTRQNSKSHSKSKR